MMTFSKLFVHAINIYFRWLYAPLAWSYDLVADAVSFGRWKKWVQAIIPMIDHEPILEIGFGPGHLLTSLAENHKYLFGVDASRQMCKIAYHRMVNAGFKPQLARAMGQKLSFPNSTFAILVATFPAPYLFESETAAEVSRVLITGGRLIVLLSARSQNITPLEKIMEFLFRQSGQQPSDQTISDHLLPVYYQFGFRNEIHHIRYGKDDLLVLVMYNDKAGPTAL